MAQINRIAKGFLDLVGAQTGGRNPSDSSDLVAPTIDMTPFYHSDKFGIVSHSITPAALGPQTALVVPSNEAWMLYGIGWSQLILNAADRAKYTVGLGSLPNSNPSADGGQPIWEFDRIATGLATPQSLAAAVQFPVPFPLQPGARFSISLTVAANFRTCFFSFFVVRLNA